MISTLLMCALQTQTVSLSPDKTSEPWQGWGTSLCWMGKVFGQREDLADALFTTKEVQIGSGVVPGLGMNIVRYNAGACSWNVVGGRRMVTSKIILPYRQMEAFWLDPTKPAPESDGWDWNTDLNQVEMMRKAKRRGADKFELFSNSPVWWMCKNDNPSGAHKASDDNLREECYDDFAIYLAEVARHSKEKWGISFTTVDPFNEPLSDWWDADCKQEGCHFSVEAQCRLLPLLRTELDKRNLKSLPIAGSDETYVEHAITAWKGYDAVAKSLVKQVNVHGYQGLISPRAKLRQTVGNLPIWLSEHGENDTTGLTLVGSILKDIHDLQPVAWSYWQPLDGSNWGLIDAEMTIGKLNEVTPKYFALAQFSRHIRKGMRIIPSSDPTMVFAHDSRSKKLVVVVANLTKTAKTKTISFADFKTVGTKIDTWITEPKRGVLYQKGAKPALDAKMMTINMPSESVQTIELRAGN